MAVPSFNGSCSCRVCGRNDTSRSLTLSLSLSPSRARAPSHSPLPISSSSQQLLYCLLERGEAGENNGYVKTISENYSVSVCSTSYPITIEHPNENLIVEINHFIDGKNWPYRLSYNCPVDNQKQSQLTWNSYNRFFNN